jgi:nitrate reductase assembly molybdenum cofactor insertion protein NarJ
MSFDAVIQFPVGENQNLAKARKLTRRNRALHPLLQAGKTVDIDDSQTDWAATFRVHHAARMILSFLKFVKGLALFPRDD